MQGVGRRSAAIQESNAKSDHRHAVAANVLARRFAAEAPDRAWVGDITYLWTREGWVCVAVVLDLYSRAVPGWGGRSGPR